MKCPQCGNYYCQVEILDNDPDICPACVGVNYDASIARHRASQIHYHKELVIIGKGEFECSGYYQDGRLWDEEITINGADVYGLISDHVQDEIFAEITRRVVSQEICQRCAEIEEELIDSDDPATLHLERSDLDGELEKLEGATG